jgi:hypothetical protein
VSALVDDEGLLLGESGLADIALERLLARVRPHVPLYIAAGLESLVAHLAAVGTLARVLAEVN